jgi:hypothetical protein
MLTLLLLAGGGSASTSDVRTEAQQVARLIFDLGSHSRLQELIDETLLDSCARVPACARDCQQSLMWLSEGKLDVARSAGLCPSLKPLAEQGALTSRAASWVMGRLKESARAARPHLDDPGRERLDCGLGWLGLSKPRPKACAREEARMSVQMFARLSIWSDEDRKRVFSRLCLELESCAGRCAEELRLITVVAWEPAQVSQMVAAAGSSPCPEFGAALATGPAEGAEERAYAWAGQRLVDFARRACPQLAREERNQLACSLVQYGLTPVPEACGGTPQACSATPVHP